MKDPCLMSKFKVQMKSKGQMEYRVERSHPWVPLFYPRIILSNFSRFDIHLTFEICHLKLMFSRLFHVPETGIGHKENGATVGAHLG